MFPFFAYWYINLFCFIFSLLCTFFCLRRLCYLQFNNITHKLMWLVMAIVGDESKHMRQASLGLILKINSDCIELSVSFAVTFREDIFRKPVTWEPLTTLKSKLQVGQNYSTSDKISYTRTIICYLQYLLITLFCSLLIPYDSSFLLLPILFIYNSIRLQLHFTLQLTPRLLQILSC